MSDSGRDRLRRLFTDAPGRAVFLPYMTAGLPTVGSSVDLFAAMAEAGADGFEVGIPYADPLMDGPTIMEAGERALAGGATVDVCLEIVAEVVATTAKPVTVMTYVNPVLHGGVDVFCGRVADAGASGLIIADLPIDEAPPFLAGATNHGLGFVVFAAPTTTAARLEAIASADPVFIYAVADLGVTGVRRDASSHLAGLSERIRAVTPAPVVAGVGIATPDQASAAAGVADGVIVGSALVRRVLDAPDAVTASRVLAAATAALAAAVH